MILIDTGDGSSSLLDIEPLASCAIPSRLPSPPGSSSRADVCILGLGPNDTPIRIGIEVKTLTELAGALRSGRLQATQLPGLLALYDLRWLLIITGATRRNPKSGALQTRHKIRGEWTWADWSPGDSQTIPYSYVQKFLLSPSFASYVDDSGEGIRHDRVFNKEEAAHWIMDLYTEYSKPWADHTSMRVLDRSGNQNGLTEASVKKRLDALGSLHDPRLKDPQFAQRVRTASSLPSVSYTRAVALAETFPSAQAIINPGCWCRETRGEDELRAEESMWAEVRVKESGGKRSRRIGKSLASEWGKAVR